MWTNLTRVGEVFDVYMNEANTAKRINTTEKTITCGGKEDMEKTEFLVQISQSSKCMYPRFL